MKVLTKNDYTLFESIVKVRQENLKKAMTNFLKKRYKNVTATKDYVFAEGNIPVTLVAHLDTVFFTLPKEIFYDTQKNVIWSPQGLGADDRAGVFAIVKIIQSGLRPHIIFTTDEEKGGLGAAKLVKDYPTPFAEMKYIIELDRQGSIDCVFYDCFNEDFIDYIESFGFKEDFGTFSDISEICPSWGIAGVNLSIGYKNEHSLGEYLSISALYATIGKVIKILNDIHNIDTFIYIQHPDIPYWWSRYPGDSYQRVKSQKCYRCGNWFLEWELIPVHALDEKSMHCYCPDCIGDKVNWCVQCGEAFEVESKNNLDNICRNCKKKGIELKIHV